MRLPPLSPNRAMCIRRASSHPSDGRDRLCPGAERIGRPVQTVINSTLLCTLRQRQKLECHRPLEVSCLDSQAGLVDVVGSVAAVLPAYCVSAPRVNDVRREIIARPGSLRR